EGSGDVGIVKKVMSKLIKGRCTSMPLYAELSGKLFSLQPTAAGARKLAARAYKSGDTDGAIKYFLQSIELETNNSNKAKAYMNLASIERRKVKNLTTSIAVQARKYALKAAELQAGWGKPYLFIGDLYASSGKLCGSGTGWESQRVSWAATDMWLKAKDIDPDVTSEANQSINKYAQYYPTVQDGFMRGGIKNGDGVSLSDCWIGGSTTARLK
ncbi:MAG: tetratricopeptide repeat protein, partial [Chitinophagales bacterium]